VDENFVQVFILTTGSVASKGTFGSRVDERDVVFKFGISTP
jgi:hypothetical protein